MLRISSLFIFFFLLPVFIFGAAKKPDFITIEKQTPTEIIFTLKPFELSTQPFNTGLQTFQQITVSGFSQTLVPGRPMLPLLGLLLINPNDTPVTMTVLESDFEEIPGIDVLPAPQILEERQNGNQSDKYKKDEATYGIDSYWPNSIVDLTQTSVWRRQKMVRVEIRPVQYNGKQKSLRFAKKLKIQLKFGNEGGSLKQPFFGVPTLSHTIQSNLNPWEQPATEKKDWRELQSTHYKISLQEDGVYSLTYKNLLDAGVRIDETLLSELKIYSKGQQIPIWIDGPKESTFSPKNTILFLGERNRTDGLYFDDYSDVNTYWLTANPKPALRYQLVDQTDAGSAQQSFYREIVHFEQNKLFHLSNGTSAIDDDEGWVWRYFFEGDEEFINFDLPNLFKDVETFTLKARFHGTTLDPVNPDHHIQISLNETVVVDTFFDGKQELPLSKILSTSTLKDRGNKLRIQLLSDTGAQVNQIYLDWLEIIVPKTYRVSGDKLQYTIENPTLPLSSFSLTNFKGQNISIFNPAKSKLWRPEVFRQSFYEVESAGFDDGNFIHFTLDDRIYSFRNRGHTIAVFDLQTGTPEFQTFDTFKSVEEANLMADYIASLLSGTLAMVGISDAGKFSMTERAYQALESLGSALTRQVQYRDSWALIGRKGDSIGMAKENLTRRFEGVAVVMDTIFDEYAFRFTAEYSDSTSSATQYFAVDSSSIKTVLEISADQSSDLKNPNQSADYIIITHEKFIEAAQSLADYRSEHNEFKCQVIDVQDIYDEFNFGIKHPHAIKNFLKFAYLNWSSPAPSYVLLLGDATWDPQKRLDNAVKTDFVPAYGSLVSDNWFVTFDGIDDIFPEMNIGRIPVEQSSQVDVFIDKLIAYENTEYDEWSKKFIFFNGGVNSAEQSIFRSQYGALSALIQEDPLAALTIPFNKNTDETITQAFIKIAPGAIREGALWINFLGHAANSVWDIDIGNPDDWQNTIFPVISAMSCHSSRFANPFQNSMAEDFVLHPFGAAAYWGSTGFGFVSQDYFLLRGMLNAISQDSVRTIGEAITQAKLFTWQQLGDTVPTRMVIEQYTLIGDPAMKLRLPSQPELAARPDDIKLKPDLLIVADSIATAQLFVRNNGLTPQDSVALQYVIKKRSGEIHARDKIEFAPVSREDSVEITFKIPQSPGEYIFEITVDSDNKIRESIESNNKAERMVQVFFSELTIIKPQHFTMLNERAPRLVINNTFRDRVGSIFYQFEIDTSFGFDSPALMRSGVVPESVMVTSWQPTLETPGIYYWRVRVDNDADKNQWETASFIYETLSPFHWQQRSSDQLKNNNLNKTATNLDNSIQIKDIQTILQAESAGLSDGLFGILSANNQVLSSRRRGHFLSSFNAFDGALQPLSTFDTYISTDEADALTLYVDNIKEGAMVLAVIRDDGSSSMTEAAHQALESIGSQYTRQVGFRDSWAIIGRKGAPIGSVKEVWQKSGEGPATVADTLSRFYTSGAMTSAEIGPALEWRSAVFDFESDNLNESIDFTVTGRRHPSGLKDTLLTDLCPQEAVDLASIDAKRYRKIQLEASLKSYTGLHTPKLKSWAVDFEPAADLIVDRNSLQVDKDTLQAGEDLLVTIAAGNFGLNPSGAFQIALNLAKGASSGQEISRINATSLSVDTLSHYTTTVSTENLQGRIRLSAILDPDDAIPEILETNNTAAKEIWIYADTVKPNIRVTFDGAPIVDGDFVSMSADVAIEFRDLAALSSADTSQITILLDQKPIPYGTSQGQARLQTIETGEDPKLQAIISFKPKLTVGEHELQILARDKSDNLSYSEFNFSVSDQFNVQDLLNYPNPFRQRTTFTYILTQPADRVHIKIYTVGGRLVTTFDDLPGLPGFNQYGWNGRDSSGDRIANGVYLYKFIARSGQNQIEKIEKLVVMR